MSETPAILLAGGAGYIGSHIAEVLRSGGFEPVVLDNLVTGNRWAVRFGPFATGPISDHGLVTGLIRKHRIEAAILLAAHAYVGESTRLPAKYYRNNVSESIAFLDSLLEVGVRKLVFSSSCSIYGIQQKMPIAESAPFDPLSPYAESKAFLERALHWYELAYGLKFVSLRYFNAAGASPSGQLGECHQPETHLIPLAVAAAQSQTALHIFGSDYPTPDGTAVRDYIHVTDLADAHVRALRHLIGGGESDQFNCGTGTGSSVRDVVNMVRAVSGREVPCQFLPRRLGDAPVLIADASRIRERLHWHPRYSSLETIVSTAWNWHSKRE